LFEQYEVVGGDKINRQTLLWYQIFSLWKQAILTLGCALRAADGKTHQDVLLSWVVRGAGYTVLEAFRRHLVVQI
jgi:hypothetical protein